MKPSKAFPSELQLSISILSPLLVPTATTPQRGLRDPSGDPAAARACPALALLRPGPHLRMLWDREVCRRKTGWWSKLSHPFVRGSCRLLLFR